jgi:hypothetical protein
VRIILDKRPYNDDIDVFMVEGFGSAARYVLPMTLSEPVLNNRCTSPTTSITKAEAQELMDNLWQVGIRPSEGTGSAGQLAATQRHLEDMRRLVFKDKEKP